MKTFDEFYEEIMERKFIEKYSVKTLFKIFWMMGNGNIAEGMIVGISEEDQDIILSPELDDFNFSKKHPELGLDDYPEPKLDDILTPEEIEEYNKELNKKVMKNV
jgi:hypothetical protein